jgi:hypothetical protein
MKYLFLLLSFQLFGQIDYSELKNDLYSKNKVKEVRIYQFRNDNYIRCSDKPKVIKNYNSFGNLIKKEEYYHLVTYYKYKYNDENFLIDVDTSGMIGIGYSIGDSVCDPTTEKCITIIESGYVGNCNVKFEEITFCEIEKAQHKTIYQYDSFCRLTGTFSYIIEDGKESFIGSLITEYNSYGLIAKEYQMNEKYEIYYVTDYEYDFY